MLKRIQADFARRRPVSPVQWVLVVLLAAVAGVGAWDFEQSSSQANSLRALLKSLAMPHGAAVAGPSALRTEPAPYHLSARSMLDQYEIPWPQALNALEGADMSGVRLQSIEYAAGEGLLRVDVTVVDPAVALQFVAALNRGSPSGRSWRWTVSRWGAETSEHEKRVSLVAKWSAQ
jgi:hypothetical protein